MCGLTVCRVDWRQDHTQSNEQCKDLLLKVSLAFSVWLSPRRFEYSEEGPLGDRLCVLRAVRNWIAVLIDCSLISPQGRRGVLRSLLVFCLECD